MTRKKKGAVNAITPEAASEAAFIPFRDLPKKTHKTKHRLTACNAASGWLRTTPLPNSTVIHKCFLEGEVNSLYALKRVSSRNKCPSARVMPPPMIYHDMDRGRRAKKTAARLPLRGDFKMDDAREKNTTVKATLPTAGIQRKTSISCTLNRSDTRPAV
jgi:hypothetical protein